MIEALEEIRKAEKAIEANKQQLTRELQRYSEEKTAAFEAKKVENQKILSKLQHEKEVSEDFELQEERKALLAEAKEVSQNLQKQYDEHYQAAIDTIIERVKEAYGSH